MSSRTPIIMQVNKQSHCLGLEQVRHCVNACQTTSGRAKALQRPWGASLCQQVDTPWHADVENAREVSSQFVGASTLAVAPAGRRKAVPLPRIIEKIQRRATMTIDTGVLAKQIYEQARQLSPRTWPIWPNTSNSCASRPRTLQREPQPQQVAHRQAARLVQRL